MKVLDLRCANGHGFEGWFAVVSRTPSAPRLNLSGAREPAAQVPAAAADVQAAWMQAIKQVLANTEDVGPRFAEEARRIHYGEVESRGIRGLATPGEAKALREEGIEFASLPVPKALKEPLQ
jgi:hypothetical protein